MGHVARTGDKRVLVGGVNERGYLEDPVLNGRIILKWFK